MKEKSPLKKIVAAFIFVLCGLTALQTGAQTLEVGLHGGLSYYIGDINPATQFNQATPAFGVLARYSRGMRWSFRAVFTATELTADDATVGSNTTRGLGFKSTVNDLSVVAEFNFFDYFTGSKRDYVTPFIFAGFSGFQFTPRSLDGTQLRPLGTEGQYTNNADGERIGPKPYNQFGFSIPFGLGVKYSLGKRVGLTVEWRMHKTFTDYLDDVSTNYYLDGPTINPNIEAQLLSDPTQTHLAGMHRGNKNTNDWFSYAGVSLTYKFNLQKRNNCNDFNQGNIW